MEIESKVTGSALTASEFNQIPDEMENLIAKSGQTASASDLTQIAKAVAQFVSDGDFYATSGTENAIVLSAVAPRVAPTALTNGMRVRFKANYDNTQAVTVNVNNLGAKNITVGGQNISTGKLSQNRFYELTYSSSTDTFELFESGSGSGGRNVGEVITSTLPLTDAGLHLLDGALIDGGGSYSAFVDYIADLYEQDPTANYFAQGRTESEVSWTQPTLTQNGTIGGDEFACAASSYPNVYMAFNSTNTQNVYTNSSSETITFYNPNPLKVTSIVWNVYDRNRNPINYTVQGSNDGSNYTDIITNQTSVAGSSTTMDMSSNTNFYKYYKIIVHTFNTNEGNLRTLSISATQLVRDAKTAEEVWQETVANYGSCGKFVYDSTNNTVRLPKVSDILQGTTDISALGDLVEAGLPNITGHIETRFRGQFYNGTGAFKLNTLIQDLNGSGSSSAYQNADFNASYSNSIYGNSTTVQPQTVKILYYIVVATSTKTEIQSDIDEIATDLNGKADTDLTNVTDTGYIKMAGAGMPSSRYINLTVGASGTQYTAPANGWVAFCVDGNVNGTFGLNNGPRPGTERISTFIPAPAKGITYRTFMPIMKNSEFTIEFYNSVTPQWLVFIYSQGEV